MADRRQEELDVIMASVQNHCALLEDEVLGQYIGAAVAQLAIRHGKTPEEVVEDMRTAKTFRQFRWKHTARLLREQSSLIRQRYEAAMVSFRARDVSAN